MTSRPKGLIAAAALALALLPGAARADTDVVLSNETTDSEVNTGASHVVNNDNVSSSSTVSGSQTAAENTGSQVAGTASATAPAGSSTAPATNENTQEELKQVAQSVEALFVGLPTGGNTVSP
jgi:hypothetical protein